MKICDSSYLIALVHPDPNPPTDRHDQPVTRFKERISKLISDLSAAGEVIGIPTPALAETLVRSGPNRAQYMKILSDSWKFQIVPFDSRAAIEAAELVAAVKNKQEKWDTWAKVKFDIQIVAIAKAESAQVIYSDDKDIENLAKRLNIRVIRICDLPLPPETDDRSVDASPLGSQLKIFDKPLEGSVSFPEPNASAMTMSQTVPLKDTSIAGTSRTVVAVNVQPCECGCGNYPKQPTSRFLPGHDLKKAYKDRPDLGVPPG